MYKYKVSGRVEVNYSIDLSLYEKLYNLYYEYPYLEEAMKAMVLTLNNKFNKEVLASELKSRSETLQKHCSISNLSDTFPANYIARTIHITDYEMTSAKTDLNEFIDEAKQKIYNMLMGILTLPHCKLVGMKVEITFIEDITEN